MFAKQVASVVSIGHNANGGEVAACDADCMGFRGESRKLQGVRFSRRPWEQGQLSAEALERLAFENMKISWWDGTEPCLNSAYTNGLCNSLEILLLKTPLSQCSSYA